MSSFGLACVLAAGCGEGGTFGGAGGGGGSTDGGARPGLSPGDATRAFCTGVDAISCNCNAQRTCTLTCANGECQDATTTCPAGYACGVLCRRPGACDELTVDCEANDSRCSLLCIGPNCSGTTFACDDRTGTNCCYCFGSAFFTCPSGTGPTSCL